MKKALICLVIMFLAWSPRYTLAQFGASIVFDPSIFGEAVAQNLNWIKSLANDAELVRQQAQMILNQGRSLAALPLSLRQQLLAYLTRYTDLLLQARGISFSLTGAVQQFDALYAAATQPADVMAKMRAMMAQVHDAGRFAMEASAVYERLCDQNTSLQMALAASSAAIGETSAIQAQTQVMGIMVDQQASLQQVLAAQARLQASHLAMQNAMAEQAQRDAAAWFSGFGSGFKPAGQTGGAALPELR